MAGPIGRGPKSGQILWRCIRDDTWQTSGSIFCPKGRLPTSNFQWSIDSGLCERSAAFLGEVLCIVLSAPLFCSCTAYSCKLIVVFETTYFRFLNYSATVIIIIFFPFIENYDLFSDEMSCILCYIIGQIILAFWLVLIYDLLEDRGIDDVIKTNILLLFLRWLKAIFPYETWALPRPSARGVTRSPEGSRDSVRDAKLSRNMGARGLLHKNFVSAKVSEQSTISLIFTFGNIHPSGNFKGKNILLNRCAGT